MEITQKELDEALFQAWLQVRNENDKIEMLKALIENGANPDYNKHGLTILKTYSSSIPNEEFVRYLIKKGANVNHREKNYEPYNEDALSLAVQYSNWKIAKILIEAGATVDWDYPQKYGALTKERLEFYIKRAEIGK
jgi:ankyrin repeat protein